MKKSKNSSWLLIGALMFFLVSAGFTTTANMSPPHEECYICAADGCDGAGEGQTGETDCEDEGTAETCELTGDYFCLKKKE